MAKASINLPINSSMGDFSIYPMKGVKKLVIRAKGGPTKNQIETEPQYAQLRRYQSEFKGVGKAMSLLVKSLFAVKHLADYNYSGNLSKICKIIQDQDEINSQGKRSILFSKFGGLLNGFSLNENNQFDTVLKQSPAYKVLRNELSASVILPGIFPGINFSNPWNLPLYRIIVGLGIVPDMVLTDHGYSPVNPLMQLNVEQVRTGWIGVETKSKKSALNVSLDANSMLDESGTLVLSVGIEFGKEVAAQVIKPVKNTGSAKVLALV